MSTRPAHWQSSIEGTTRAARPLSEIIDDEQHEQLKQQRLDNYSSPYTLKNGFDTSDQSAPFNHPNLSGQTVTHQNAKPPQQARRVTSNYSPGSQETFTANEAVLNSPSVQSRLRNAGHMNTNDDDGSVFSFLINTPTSPHTPGGFPETPNASRSVYSVDNGDSPARDNNQPSLGSYSSATAAALANSQNNLNSFYGSQSLYQSIQEDNQTSESEYENEAGYNHSRSSYASSHHDTSNSILNPRDHLNSVFIQDPDAIALPGSRPQLGAQSPPPSFPLPTPSSLAQDTRAVQSSSAEPAHAVNNQTSQETVVSQSQKLNQPDEMVSTNYNDYSDKPVKARLSNSSSRYDDDSEYLAGTGANANSAGGPVLDSGLDKEFALSGMRAVDASPPGGNGGSGKGGSLWKRKRNLCITLIILAFFAILAAVLIPVGLLVIGKDKHDSTSSSSKPSSSSSSSGSGSGSGSSSANLPSNLKGSIYDTSTWKDKTGFNTTFTDVTVGGLPIMGLNTTFNDTAQANPHVPPINQKFTYGQLPMRGVNLGGWLVLEPFITPSLFSKYDINQGIVDEWTLINYLNSTGGMKSVVDVMETHYSTFVTETDFKEIQEAGLDHIRIPFGYWAVQTFDGDQFLPQISWRYLLRGIEWARKYGLRVNIDLHSAPGGQNGWNHSGRQGVIQWLNGTDGQLNAQRTLDIHSKLSKFFAQDRYKNVVTIYGLVNEPRMEDLNQTAVINWTKDATNLIRNNGYEGVLVFGDGFLGVDAWKGVFPESQFPNLALDVHQYTIFDVNLLQMSHSAKINFVCTQWKAQMTRSSNVASGHGPTFAGEWSQADNDCTLYLNNVGVGSRWEGKFSPGGTAVSVSTMSCNGGINCSCNVSNSDPSTYSDVYKKFLLNFAEVQMEVFESGGGWGSMYWAWDTETIEASQWSYKKARDAGIMPKVAYERTFNCSTATADFLGLGLPEGV